MELAALYDPAGLERAFALAHEYTTYSQGFVRGLLESADRPAVDAPTADLAVLAGRALPAASVRADLGRYQQLLEVSR